MMHDVLVNAFLDEMTKLSMARISMEPGSHVALRLMQRAGLSRSQSEVAERALKKAMRSAGGDKHLGQGDYFLPVGDKGTLVFSHRGQAGHVVSTLLGPGMTSRGQHIGRSGLEKEEVKALKKGIKRALKPQASQPSGPTDLRRHRYG